MMRKTKAPLRALSLLVMVVLAGTSIALSLVVRSIVNDQQARMLHERTSEGAVLLGTLFGGVQANLPTLAASAPPELGSAGSFTAAARPLLGLATTIGALGSADGVFSVVAAVGKSPATGLVASDRAALASRALTTKGVVSAVVETPKGRRLSFAMATGNGLVLYEDLAFDPAKPINIGTNGPFSDLQGAVYASAREDPGALVLTTAHHLPLSGALGRHTVTVGADKWLLVTKATHSFVGSFAANAPWWVLLAGLLAALLTTGLVETLSRRRAYAMALVDERTLELRQAREVAEAANRSKSEFLSRMSHELRTPLNAVLGFGQLLELDELTETQRESVDQIVRGGRHLLDLINEVLDISRIETGSLPLSPEPVLVIEVISDTLTLMRPLADQRHVQLVADVASVPGVHVMADRQRLKQVLLNLVANAIKYNKESGTVAVSCEAMADDRLRINVADTGPGIPAEDLDRLFVPFERLGAERSDVEGSGVGLALSRRLTEAMGGQLGVESTYGEGSQFWVELAAVEDPVDRYERLEGDVFDPIDSQDAASEPRHKVLYIEDNLSNVRLVERVLAGYDGVEVIPAMQGRLGLALAREHRPVLILLDLHLPDVDGHEVLHQLRADPITATTPVVMVSADATAGQVERLLAAGANAYLTKPLEVKDLIALVTETIRTTSLSEA